MRLIILAVIAFLSVGGWLFAQKAKNGIAVKQFVQEKVGAFPVTGWEHGFETSRVKASRMHSDTMGWNIKMEFPKNAYDCDRAEVGDWIAAHGGNIFQGGGYPGAPAFIGFKDVTDRESADRKLREILPALSQLMQDISDGKEIPPIVNPDAKVWPDADPPDKTNEYWEFNNNLNVNGTQYKKVEVVPGKWQWKEDEAAMKFMRDAERHKMELWFALTTRVLTDDELKEAVSYGSFLNLQTMVPYNAEEKSQELTSAFLVQQRLRESQAAK